MEWGDVPGWIQALSTLALGVAAGLFAMYRWRESDFKPKAVAFVDTPRRRIAIEVTNRGRTSGTLVTVDPHERGRKEVIAHKLVGGQGPFTPVILQPGDALLLVIACKGREAFPSKTSVTLKFSRRSITVEPETSSNLDLSEAESTLPIAVRRS